MLDLRLLRYFVAVAEEGNFNRAAERLHIAQPPLSRAVQQLEADIGAPLLDRSSRPLTLTAVGELVHAQARQMLSRLDDMETMVKAAVGSRRRRFVVGFVSSVIYARLPELIREFRAQAGDIDLVMVESNTLDQIAALKDGRIDVGFGRIRFDDPAVRRIILRNERLVAAFPMGHRLAHDVAPISLRELAGEPLIVYPRAPRPSYADQVISLFHDHSIEPRIIHEVREFQIAIGLVAAEEGIAIVPESVHRSRSHDVVYRELAETAVSPIIMSHRGGDQSPELALIGSVIARKYRAWGYEVPSALTHAEQQAADRVAAT